MKKGFLIIGAGVLAGVIGFGALNTQALPVNADATVVDGEWQGWTTSQASGYTASAVINNGSLTYDVTAVPETLVSYGAKISKYSQFYTAGSYEAIFNLSASAAISGANVVVATSSPWNSYNSLYSQSIGTTAADYRVIFTLSADHSDVEFDIEVGSCGAATVYLNCVTINAIDSSLLNETTWSADNYATRLDSGAEVSAITANSDSVELSVTTYPTAGNNWALGLFRSTDINIVSGQAYHLTMTVWTKYAQYFEVLSAPNVWGPDESRIYHGTLTNPANTTATFDYVFVADKAIASTKIGFYFGTDGRVSGETDNQIVKITGISLKQAELKNTYTYALTAANLGAYLMDQDVANQCTSKYTPAKAFYNALSAEEKALFVSSSSNSIIANGALRYAAWAANQENGATPTAWISEITVFPQAVIWLIAGAGALATAAFLVFLKKKKSARI